MWARVMTDASIEDYPLSKAGPSQFPLLTTSSDSSLPLFHPSLTFLAMTIFRDNTPTGIMLVE